ncbi:MAG: DUF1440 domain-containing protein [Anaerolineae bacterium]|jgi:uncharacterized membrane protein YagU involved in acid resistance|nr:DUF1440 domain-containing protein [Anaerolineae bacterium]
MTAAVQAAGTTQNTVLVKTITTGTIAGLVGGSVFGVQMVAGNMLPMVAQMVGSTSVVVGFIVHMLISAVIGGTFALLAARLPGVAAVQTGAGLLYGVVWWILGALIIMPLALGMNDMVLQVGDMQWLSLVGHGFFGVVLGVTYLVLRRLDL